MKFLLVSYSFAPLNIISAQRLNSWARFLVSQGHEVDVLTSVKAAIDGPVDDFQTFESIRSLVKIHEVPFMGHRLNEDSGPDNLPGSKGVGDLNRRGRLKRLKSVGTFFLGSFFDYRTLWSFAAYKHYANHLGDSDYDIVLTSSGPPCVNLLGYRIKRRSPGQMWIADFRDLWSLSPQSAASVATKYFERKIERYLLADADIITTVSEDLSRQMYALHNHKQVQIIRNGFEAAEISDVVPDNAFFERVGVADRTNIVYAGSIHPGRRDPTRLIQEVISAGSRDSMAVHFFGFNLGNVESIIQRLDAQDFCFLHGSKPRTEILSIQAAADINLFLESGKQDARGMVTGKLFELAAISRPILSIGPADDFESIAILKRTGLLIHWETEIEAGLGHIISKSKTLRPANEYISGLARNHQFQKILELFEDESALSSGTA